MDRYDRQLRLWGDTGQELLQTASICIVTGQYPDILIHEILKNVFLLGISDITIVTTRDECAMNSHYTHFPFFTEEALFGKKGLIPIGGDGKKQWRWQEARQDLNWSLFSAVLHVNIEPDFLTEWDRFLKMRHHDVAPTLSVTITESFLNYQLTLNEPHFIMHTHPDHELPILRFNTPWPKLREFIDSYDFTGISSDEFTKVPYPIIIFKVLKLYPEASSSTKEFKEKLDIFLSSIDLPINVDLNVIEARRFSHLATKKKNHELEDILDLLKKCDHYLGKEDQIKWHVVFNQYMAALLASTKVYLEEFGNIPLTGQFPDMESGSTSYNRLKSIYDEKKLQDFKAFKVIVHKKYGNTIPDVLIAAFCKNIRHIDCILPTEYNKIGNSTVIGGPQVATNTISEYKYPTLAFIGGLISQEVIKIITHQYIPIKTRFKYDTLTVYSGTYNNL